jgi:hypothetical protein
VKVSNDRAGHDLPTSLTEVREVWLEVIVTDDQGRELLRNGSLDEHNHLPPDTVVFNSHAVDKDGNHTHFPWEIVRFSTRNTIPPKGYKYGEYWFNVPNDAEKVTVVAKLHYRSFGQHLADELLGEGAVTVPSVEMVAVEKTYPVADLAVTQKIADAGDAGHEPAAEPGSGSLDASPASPTTQRPEAVTR